MWERRYFSEQIIEEEIIQMKNLGLNLCRSFLFLPTFFPKPNVISEQHLERYMGFLKLCEKHGLKTLLTFIVGHMSGENFDPPFRKGRDLYTDEFMLKQQCFFVRSITERVKNYSSLYGYILSNEMPLYGGQSESHRVSSWAKKLVEAIRSVDPTRPIGTGDGCWNIFGGENGFNLNELSKIVDYFGPHVYLSETDDYRHSMIPEFAIRYLSQYDLPILYEEFGASSSQASDENIALYYREVLLSALVNGAIGALGWCLNDFSYTNMKPYIHHPFELRFGILNEEGTPKPAALEIASFRKFIDNLDDLKPNKAQAAVIVPSYYNKTYPFSFDEPRETFKHFLQAAVLCAKAGFEVDFIEEEKSEKWREYKLVILPSERKYLATTWENLKEYLHAGGNLYLSYYWGNYDFHQGIWSHNLEGLIGAKLDLRYGLKKTLPSKVALTCAGTTWYLSTERCGTWSKSYASLSATTDTAEKMVVGESGLSLIKNKVGKGVVFFLNFPLEHILSVEENIKLYRSEPSVLQIYCDTTFRLHTCYSDNAKVRVRKINTAQGKIYLLQNVSWEREWVNFVIDDSVFYSVKTYLEPKGYRAIRIGKTHKDKSISL